MQASSNTTVYDRILQRVRLGTIVYDFRNARPGLLLVFFVQYDKNNNHFILIMYFWTLPTNFD
jgi:hypothetical protein